MGELFGENLVKKIAPDSSKLGRAAGIGGKGIDDLYQVNRADVDYVVIEYKFNKSTLGKTADGKQGSESWILGSERLKDAVGEAKAHEIRDAMTAGRVETWVVRTLPDGTAQVRVLDANGYVKDIDTSSILSELNLDTVMGNQP